MRYYIILCVNLSLLSGGPAYGSNTNTKPAQHSEITSHILQAELAKDRGQADIAMEHYIKAITISQDPNIARQATEYAVSEQNLEAAQRTSNLWANLAPQDLEAQIVAITLNLSIGSSNIQDYLQTAYNISKQSTPDPTAPSLIDQHLIAIYVKLPENSQTIILQAITKLEAKQTDNASKLPMLATRAQLAALSGKAELTQDLVKQLLQLNSASTVGIELNAKLMHYKHHSSDSALKYLKSQVERYPKNQELRWFYINALLDNNYEQQALPLLKTLEQAPEYRIRALTTIGEIYLKQKNYALAKKSLSTCLKMPGCENSSQFLLGQTAEQQKNVDLAIDWYSKVNPGDYHIPARLRAVELLHAQKKYQNALDVLANTEPQDINDYKKIALLAININLEQGQAEEALKQVNSAIQMMPDDLDLYYARSLVNTELKDVAQVELDLKKILTRHPEHAHALNTLGYALANFTNRYQEARTYLEKAVSLEPENAAFMDSLGWLEYKSGNMPQALQLLKRAYTNDKNVDIAAHYAEVLWHHGDKKLAQQILNTAKTKNPDNTKLLSVINSLTNP